MTDPQRRDTPSDADSSDETIIYTYDQRHSTYGEADADAVSIKGIYIEIIKRSPITHIQLDIRCR